MIISDGNIKKELLIKGYNKILKMKDIFITNEKGESVFIKNRYGFEQELESICGFEELDLIINKIIQFQIKSNLLSKIDSCEGLSESIDILINELLELQSNLRYYDL